MSKNEQANVQPVRATQRKAWTPITVTVVRVKDAQATLSLNGYDGFLFS